MKYRSPGGLWDAEDDCCEPRFDDLLIILASIANYFLCIIPNNVYNPYMTYIIPNDINIYTSGAPLTTLAHMGKAIASMTQIVRGMATIPAVNLA